MPDTAPQEQQNTEAEATSGTLRVLAYVTPSAFGPRAHCDYTYLSADGQPREFAVSGTDMMNDVDFADEEGAPLPDCPTERGLWVLEWPWRMEEIKDWPDHFAPQYYDGRWVRPSLADLVAFNALPAEGSAS